MDLIDLEIEEAVFPKKINSWGDLKKCELLASSSQEDREKNLQLTIDRVAGVHGTGFRLAFGETCGFGLGDQD